MFETEGDSDKNRWVRFALAALTAVSYAAVPVVRLFGALLESRRDRQSRRRRTRRDRR